MDCLSILSIIGNIFSILGFIITICIWIKISNIRSFYNAIGTIPSRLNQLSNIRKGITDLLNENYTTSTEDKIILDSNQASVIIKNILPKFENLDKTRSDKQIKPNMEKFSDLHNNFIINPNITNAREMNFQLHMIVTSGSVFMEDENWRYKE